MASNTSSMAVFCDFENIAIGVHEAKFAKFNFGSVLERLLVKGNIVVKKAYCDWGRYDSFKKAMHEAGFELIDIPHVRQSGKNSADIRLVVDALDLCYTKSHVDTFVIVSGDSDFSPLVSKLRENNKLVIGVGVKRSTSDLLVGNCDEFIFYDDLVRVPRSAKARPRSRAAESAAKTGRPKRTGAEDDAAPEEALQVVIETLEALGDERDQDDRIWGSMIKQAIKRRDPGFSERAYGFRSFNDLLLEAQKRGALRLEHDPKSGGYVVQLMDEN